MSRAFAFVVGLFVLPVVTGCDDGDDDASSAGQGTSVANGDPPAEDCLPPPRCGEPCPVDGECCPCFVVEDYCTTTPEGRSGIMQCQMYGEDAALAGGSCYEVEPCDEGSVCVPAEGGLASCDRP
jgi:hypothetical protein